MGVEELQQQWETLATSRQLPHHLFWKLIHQVTDGLPFESAVVHAAGVVIAVAEHPGFANRTVRQRRAQQARQPSAAPEAILIDRLKSQWVQNSFTQGAAYCPTGSVA